MKCREWLVLHLRWRQSASVHGSPQGSSITEEETIRMILFHNRNFMHRSIICCFSSQGQAAGAAAPPPAFPEKQSLQCVWTCPPSRTWNTWPRRHPGQMPKPPTGSLHSKGASALLWKTPDARQRKLISAGCIHHLTLSVITHSSWPRVGTRAWNTSSTQGSRSSPAYLLSLKKDFNFNEIKNNSNSGHAVVVGGAIGSEGRSAGGLYPQIRLAGTCLHFYSLAIKRLAGSLDFIDRLQETFCSTHRSRSSSDGIATTSHDFSCLSCKKLRHRVRYRLPPEHLKHSVMIYQRLIINDQTCLKQRSHTYWINDHYMKQIILTTQSCHLFHIFFHYFLYLNHKISIMWRNECDLAWKLTHKTPTTLSLLPINEPELLRCCAVSWEFLIFAFAAFHVTF